MRSWMRSAPVALGLAVAMGSNLVLADEAPRTVVSRVTGVAADPKWEEEYAYSLGVQAYVFAFPWYYNQLLRWRCWSRSSACCSGSRSAAAMCGAWPR